MTETDDKRRAASEVDYLVDENSSQVELPDGTDVAPANGRPTVGATGPTNWWRTGVIALAIVIAILLLLQLAGGWPGTDVQPGTPVAEPETAIDQN